MKKEEFIRDFIKVRKNEKISQAELSKMNNVYQSIVSRIERMKSANLETVINLLDSIGYKLSITQDYNNYNLIEISTIRSFLSLYNYFKNYKITNICFDDNNLEMIISRNNLYLKFLFKDLIEFKLDTKVIEYIDIKYADNRYYFLNDSIFISSKELYYSIKKKRKN